MRFDRRGAWWPNESGRPLRLSQRCWMHPIALGETLAFGLVISTGTATGNPIRASAVSVYRPPAGASR